MQTFQLFKERSFGDYITDVFSFIRQRGKHFFGLYFSLCLPVLLGVIAVFYSFMNRLQLMQMQQLQDKMNPGQAQWMKTYSELFGNLFDGSFGGIALVIGVAVVMIVFSVFLQAFPIFYFKLLEEKETFGLRDIWQMWCEKWPRLFGFFLKSLITIVPAVLILVVLNSILAFLIIGIPLFFITLPAIFIWVYQSLVWYVLEGGGFRDSLSVGMAVLRRQFWALIGASLVLYIIMYIVQLLFSLIPTIIGVFQVFSAQDSGQITELPLAMSIGMILSMLVGLIAQNALIILQCIVHYSYREATESRTSHDDIDQIGQSI